MRRTCLYADPKGLFLQNLILESCKKFGEKTALVDTSCSPPRYISYAEYGELVEQVAAGLASNGLKPGDIVSIYLPNSWEFCVAYHAATLAGGVPTLSNPSHRERELRYQLENSGASVLITDARIKDINLTGLPNLRRVYTIREHTPGTAKFSQLLRARNTGLPTPEGSPEQTLAALPYSSGTTGLPKGVILSHSNLVTNIYQLLSAAPVRTEDVMLCFIPLYHIYGLNVILSPALTLGATLVLMPRFEISQAVKLIAEQSVSFMACVPPVLNAFSQAAQEGVLPRNHTVRWCKCGAAPLPPDVAHRLNEHPGILICQGSGRTADAPVTHIGFLEPDLYRPESIGQPVAQTDCRVLDENDQEVGPGERGELIMRGPQFMLGYWKDPSATAAVMRDGWYWSGDVVRRDCG